MLSSEELKAAVKLQKRLKRIRLWLRIGHFLYRPWKKWDAIYAEEHLKLERYYSKFLGEKETVDRPAWTYSPEEIIQAKKNIDQLLDVFRPIGGSHGR